MTGASYARRAFTALLLAELADERRLGQSSIELLAVHESREDSTIRSDGLTRGCIIKRSREE